MSYEDLVDVLAVARITRLVIEDRVPFGAWRERYKKRALVEHERVNAVREAEDLDDLPIPLTVELLGCPWCASVWVALAVLFLRRLPGWRFLARILAASQVAGMAATWVER